MVFLKMAHIIYLTILISGNEMAREIILHLAVRKQQPE